MSRFSFAKNKNSFSKEEIISRVGVIITRVDDQNETRVLLMKRIDHSWVDTDGHKVKWSFPKTGQNLTEQTNMLQTAMRVCETKLKTSIAANRFHYIFKITPHRAMHNTHYKSLEYYWFIEEKEKGEFLHLSGTEQDGSMETQYIWVTLDELKELNKYDAICYGAKQWLRSFSLSSESEDE